MQWGLGPCGLAPETLWSMTPRELQAAAAWLEGQAGPMPPTRGDLDRLIERYPDGGHHG